MRREMTHPLSIPATAGGSPLLRCPRWWPTEGRTSFVRAFLAQCMTTPQGVGLSLTLMSASERWGTTRVLRLHPGSLIRSGMR